MSSNLTRLSRITGLSLVSLGWSAALLPAGTIRSDRDPQAYLNYAQTPAFASAGRLSITRSDPGFSGSGVLIGDRWVLTAAHLLEGAATMTFNVAGKDYAADGWVAHTRFDGDFRKGYDIGLVRLAEPVTGITPAALNRSRKEQGQVASFVGFGRTGDGTNGGQPLDQVDFLGRAGTNVIDGTVDLKLGFGHYKEKLAKNSRVFVADFDNPTNPADNVTGSPTPTDLEYLIAQGDSGGPVFIDGPDGPVVAGIHSFGEFIDERDDSDYGDVTGHTRVSLARPWIEKTIRRGNLGRDIRDYVDAAGSRELGPITSVVPEPSAAIGLALAALGFAGSRTVSRKRAR